MSDDNSFMNIKTLKDTLFSDTSMKADENAARFSSTYHQAGNKNCVSYMPQSAEKPHFIKRLD